MVLIRKTEIGSDSPKGPSSFTDGGDDGTVGGFLRCRWNLTGRSEHADSGAAGESISVDGLSDVAKEICAMATPGIIDIQVAVRLGAKRIEIGRSTRLNSS